MTAREQVLLLTDYLERTAHSFPEKVAVVDGERRLTFGELRHQSKLIAQRIPMCVKNSPIAVLLPKSAASIVAFLAVLYSGNFYVPVDVSSPTARKQKILSQLRPSLVITEKDYFDPVLAGDVDFDVLFLEEFADFSITNDSYESPPAESSQRALDLDPAYCIFTSGSTGEPKGVLVSHRAVIDYIDWARTCFEVAENERIANQAPFHFDNSVLDLFLTMATGAQLHLVPDKLFAFPATLVDYLEINKISFVFWVPSVLKGIVSLDVLKSRVLPSLRKILFAGEVMPCKTLNYWRSKVPNALYANLYGPTEATVDCTYFVVDREFEDGDSLPIGRERENLQVLVLGVDDLPVQGDAIGELCIRGSSLAIGYWRASEKTAKSFVQNPLISQYPDYLYRTGDLVRYNQRGELLYCGRKDQQIKYLGHRIELGEIEAVVNTMPGINEVSCHFSETHSQIWLFYSASSAKITDNHVHSALQSELPKYMLPKVIRKLSELPHLSNGKIDKVGLQELVTS